MSTKHRRHPLSLAISMSLLAAVATSAMASSPTGAAQVDTSGRQASAPQDASATPSKAEQDKDARKAVTLSVVEVVGVRASQMRAIELKRTAQDIQDSITAESIGQLPDVTITDALQRVTGVQVNRDAGVGTTVDVRGLPEVGTMLNGEVFITPDQIDSQQPDFTMLPATLFRGVDVLKSKTASTTDGGISGALDLHTYRQVPRPIRVQIEGATDTAVRCAHVSAVGPAERFHLQLLRERRARRHHGQMGTRGERPGLLQRWALGSARGRRF